MAERIFLSRARGQERGQHRRRHHGHLLGDAKPSGKLPQTWPRAMSQIPINDGDASYDPLYAYGYGLSY
jgi:Glycosyl hydrolase family 3 C-terminal domain